MESGVVDEVTGWKYGMERPPEGSTKDPPADDDTGFDLFSCSWAITAVMSGRTHSE